MGVFTTDGKNQFSGTFLRIDDRYYAVTAGHCIHDTEDLSTLRVSTHSHQSPALEIGDATAVLYRPRPDGEFPLVDVSILTLSPDHAHDLGVEWITASEATSAHAVPGALTCLAGFPSQLLKVAEAARVVVHPTPFVYVSHVSERLPDVQVPVDPSIGFLVEYEAEDVKTMGGGHQSIKPYGMSGCGVFVVPRPAPDRLWAPTGIQLAGIQSSFFPAEGLLGANRIEYVFQLLRLISGAG